MSSVNANKPLSKDQALKMVEAFSHVALTVLETTGQHEMICTALTPSGIHFIDLTRMLDIAEQAYDNKQEEAGDRAKDFASEGLRFLIKKLEAFGTVILNEAWVTMAKPGDFTEMGGDEPGKARMVMNAQRPRNNPERKEALTMSYEFKLDSGERLAGSRMWIFDRVRERIIIGEMRESGEMVEGRFAKLLT